MAKQLKFWNGRPSGKWSQNQFEQGITFVSFNIAAYSRAEAARILNEAPGAGYISGNEIKDYYSPTWGNSMNDLKDVVTEPGLWVTYYQNGKRKRLKLV